MSGKRRSSNRRRVRGRSHATCEWVGGWLAPPFFIAEQDEAERVVIAVWLELPSGLIVGEEIVEARATAGALGRTLQAALDHPRAGPRRRPDAIRVAEAAMAREVRAVVGEMIPVSVAPTPEMDELLESLVEHAAGGFHERTYLEGGRLRPDAVGKLFAAAEALFLVAPWETAMDSQVLRVDIPELGVDGACVSILGHLEESIGFLVFPSLERYEAFRAVAEGPIPPQGPKDLGTGWLSLGFEEEDDFPRAMQSEARDHGWVVAGEDAWPMLERRGSDGHPQPLVERDLEIAAACAEALAAFFVRHEDLFDVELLDPATFEPVCESFVDRDDREVRITVPPEAFPLFDVGGATVPPARASKVGRNDPCPCGSGRKYKKCHLPLEGTTRPAEAAGDARHELDAELVVRLQEFAKDRFGAEWLRFARDFTDDPYALELSRPWSVYVYRVQGKAVAEWYLDEHSSRLSRAEREWMAAQRESWLSIWEVTAVEPGTSITLQDLLSGETRRVREASASENLVRRDALLARVVDHDDRPLLCGVHPRPLPPIDAAEVVGIARKRLRRKRAVPVERLREEKFGRYIIRRWDEAVAALDARSASPPELRNTDGDPLLLTTDHFEVAPGGRAAVETALGGMEGAQPPGSDEEPAVWVFLGTGAGPGAAGEGSPVVGHAELSRSTLKLSTNSRERADALRARVEAACGDQLRHRGREHVDPLSAKMLAARDDLRGELPTPEEEAVIRSFRQRHYSRWLDEALPALGGKTPREAVRSAEGRFAVDALLKEMENMEERFAGAEGFDFAPIRRELRLE